MHRAYRLITIFLLHFSISAAESLTDNQFGYTIFLPEGWVREIVSGSHHRFFDTSGTYQSIIAIVKYDLSTSTVYTCAEEWTRANFIAYAFIVDADPLSALVFYDTVTARQNDSIPAADAFSVFYETDTNIGNWAEYVRYTATGSTGYEIYALGPLDDMQENIGFYAAIIYSTVISGGSNNESVVPRQAAKGAVITSILPYNHKHIDLLGRVTGRKNHCLASQIIVNRNRTTGIIR